MAYLSTTDGYQLYYEQHGNLSGPTVLFLHGGPGLGTSPKDLCYFDTELVNVILLDQRGCGKSQVTDDLMHNTSQMLVNDISVLLDHLQIDQVILFGGSWGSTLSLLFGIAHPERVAGMILRGLFTASKKERQFFEEGGTQLFFPRAWKRYRAQVSASHTGDISAYYFEQILYGQPPVQKHLAYEMMYYGLSVSRKKPYRPTEVEMRLAHRDFLASARLLAHYSIHQFFLTDEYILRHLATLQDIPIYLVQGRYDMITTPQLAIELADRFQNIQLRLIDAGHSPHEPPLRLALQEAVKDFLRKLE